MKPKTKAKKRRYRNVSCRMWTGSPDFINLSKDGKLAWLFLITGPQTEIVPGLFSLGSRRMAEEVGFTDDEAKAALDEIVAAGMARVDASLRFVWVPKALDHNPPESPNVVRSWRHAWDLFPKCQLLDEATASFRSLLADMGDAYLVAFEEALGERTASPSTNPSGVGPKPSVNPSPKPSVTPSVNPSPRDPETFGQPMTEPGSGSGSGSTPQPPRGGGVLGESLTDPPTGDRSERLSCLRATYSRTLQSVTCRMPPPIHDKADFGALEALWEQATTDGAETFAAWLLPKIRAWVAAVGGTAEVKFTRGYAPAKLQERLASGQDQSAAAPVKVTPPKVWTPPTAPLPPPRPRGATQQARGAASETTPLPSPLAMIENAVKAIQ